MLMLLVIRLLLSDDANAIAIFDTDIATANVIAIDTATATVIW